jgi:hypothetical protein
MKQLLIWCAVLLGALSSGCSGSSSGYSVGGGVPHTQTPQPLPPNLEAAPAPQEPFNVGGTYTATSGANSYTAIYGQTPTIGTTMFDGQAANSSAISLTVTENGSTIDTETSNAYYLLSPYQPLGLSGTVNGAAYAFLFTSTDPLPATLTVGTSGPLGSGTYYAAGTNTVIGSLTETYSVTAVAINAVQLTISGSGTVNGSSVDETFTYTVDTSGTLALQSLQLTVSGTALTFTPAPGPWGY